VTDLRELYQEVILDHSRKPRNFREMAEATRTAVGNNPLCGDRVTVYLRMDGDRVIDASFQGQGCAISKSSASMMTDAVKGKTRAEADEMFERFHRMVTSGVPSPDDVAILGKLAVFAGVSEFPIRVKCASLAWHTLRAALEAQTQIVSTE